MYGKVPKMSGSKMSESKKTKKPPQVAIMVVTSKALPARGGRTATNKAKKAK